MFLPSPPSFVLNTANTVGNNVITTVFNKVFAQEIQNGNLDFLKNNWVLIEITDFGLSFSLSLKDGKLINNSNLQQADLKISAKSCDFLSMIARKKDPDTLFFQRKIKMHGSTELGLFVKNFLDSFDTSSNWVSSNLDKIIQKGHPFLQKIFCET